MNFEKFLLAKEPDFKGRAIQDIWNFSDEQIEHTHDFIQLLFPNNQNCWIGRRVCLNIILQIVIRVERY